VPIQSMNCPKCGKPASEYMPGKWECLSCRSRFIYEEPLKPDRYLKVERTTRADDSMFFVCTKCCVRFPRAAHGEYVCPRCKRSYCQEHRGSSKWCLKCRNRMLLFAFLILCAIGAVTQIISWLLAIPLQ
jgi:hypothetical protein